MFGSYCRRPKSKRSLPADRLRSVLSLQWVQLRSQIPPVLLLLVGVLALALYQNRIGFESQQQNAAMGQPSAPDIVRLYDGVQDLGWKAPRWLRDYVQFCGEPDTDTTRYLIWSCTDQYCSGIGDRIRGILTAFYLAVGTRRKLKIHCIKPVNLNRSLQPSWIDWSTDADILFAQAPERVRVHARNDTLAYAYDTDHLRIASIFTTAMEQYALYSAPQFAARFYGDEIRVGPDNWDLLATWAWDVLFQPSPELQAEIDAVRSDADLSGDYIAVHVRHGGHWGDWLRHDTDQQLSQFIECATNMTKSMGGDPLIYVASDDVCVKEEFRKALAAVRYDPQPPRHIEKTRDYEEQLRIWAEFEVIRQSSCIVASLSGFSLWPVMTTRDPVSGRRCWARFDRCSMEMILRSRSGTIPAYDAPSANHPDFGITALP